MKYMVLLPNIGSLILPDGSGDYHVDEFDSVQEALKYVEAARSVSSIGHAKKIRCIEYREVLVERTREESVSKKDGV